MRLWRGSSKTPRKSISSDPCPISTLFAERQNPTMRMHMRRFMRLINAFRRKIENHTAAVALHSMYYNFIRVHQTLKATPAMAVGVTDIYAKQDHVRRAKSAPPEAGDVWTWTAI